MAPSRYSHPKSAPPPRTIRERADELGQIYAFDSDAFRGDKEATQELCDAMLALAVASNDCRDLLLWMDGLMEEKPSLPARLNRLYGEHAGTTLHTFRLLAGLLHEVGEVVRKNSRAFNESFFRKKVLGKLGPQGLEMWSRVTALATGKKVQKQLDQLLDLLRNKAAYHYDGDELRKAYGRRFPTGSRDREKTPLAARGSTVFANRFFFADAAAQEVIEGEATGRGLMPLAAKMSVALRDFSMTLAVVIDAFIEARTKGKWKQFVEDP